jgi:hypothetical protein
MTEWLHVVSMDRNGVTHDTVVEIPTSVRLSDVSTGQAISGLAWFNCASYPAEIMRWTSGVAVVDKDVDCMACIAVGAAP